MRTTIKELLGDYKKLIHHDVTVQGWVRAFRSNRFIALNDGSTINNLQVVVDFEQFDENILKNISNAASLKIVGELVESQGAGTFAFPYEFIQRGFQSKKFGEFCDSSVF